MVFTDEEKSTAKQTFLKLYEPFKIAQRYLAIIYSIPYVTAWIVTFFASFKYDVTTQVNFLISSDVGMINAIIIGFYFCGGMGEGMIKVFKK